MQYEDFGNIDYSNRRDDYILPLTTTLDDKIEGRYGENIVGLRGLESGINSYVSGGTKKFAYNVASGYKINPMLGAITSNPEQWAVSALGKIPGVKGATKSIGSAFNYINPTGFSLKYLNTTAAEGYDNAWAGLNLVKDGKTWKGFGKGLDLAKKGFSKVKSSRSGMAMKSAFNVGATDTALTQISKTGLRIASGYALGSLAGKTVGSAFDESEIGGEIGGAIGGSYGLISSVGQVGKGAFAKSSAFFHAKTASMAASIGKDIAKSKIGAFGSRIASTKLAQTAMYHGKTASMALGVGKNIIGSKVSAMGAAKVVGAGLSVVNALSLVDMPFMVADIASDIRMQGQIDYISGFEGRQQEIRNNPTNTQMINRNVGMSNSNQNEMNYLLTRPNLARDMSYRYTDANYGF